MDVLYVVKLMTDTKPRAASLRQQSYLYLTVSFTRDYGFISMYKSFVCIRKYYVGTKME